jgi:hypothetical protein
VILEEYPEFLSPVGVVSPFSLQLDMSGAAWWRYLPSYKDPGPPPYSWWSGAKADYKAGFEQVVEFSSYLDRVAWPVDIS